MSETKTVAVRVNVTPALHAELAKRAERADVSIAHVVRRAVRLYLTKTEGADDGRA